MLDTLSQIVLNTLIDSIWLGGFSWLLLIVLLKIIHVKHASLRYYLTLVLYFGYFATIFILTTAQDSIYQLWLKPKFIVFSDYFTSFSLEFNFIEKIQLFIINNSQFIFWFWSISVVFFIVKFFFQYKSISTIQETIVTDDSINIIKNNLINKLGIKKKVSLKKSKNVSHAFTIGHLKPIIFLPVQAISGFSIVELEMILFHELTHIKRYDYIINIAQLILKKLFFFNPFVLFMSRIIQNERETSCDAIVINYGYSKTSYAKALQNSYNLHYKLALNFGHKNVFSRIKFLTLSYQHKHNKKTISQIVLSGLSLCVMVTILGFGVSTKNNLSINPITKGMDIYPKFTFNEDNVAIIFYPDTHRAWHIHKNGEQEFYRDGILRNDELEANFEYKEIYKGDIVEILYIDKVLNKEHKAVKNEKLISECNLFIKELYTDFDIKKNKYDINELMKNLHITPFGDMYFNDKKVSKKLQQKYQTKYSKGIFKFYYSYLGKETEILSFIKNIIFELQKDNLIDSNFNSAQVIFKLQKGRKLLLNGKLLHKKQTEKYLIYLNKLNAEHLYEEHSFYLK